MASRTPTKKRATPASARVTDSSKKSGKKFGGFAYAGADAAPRRALNFVDDGSASDDDDIFVPVATHKLVGYKREGETEPAPHAAAMGRMSDFSAALRPPMAPLALALLGLSGGAAAARVRGSPAAVRVTAAAAGPEALLKGAAVNCAVFTGNVSREGVGASAARTRHLPIPPNNLKEYHDAAQDCLTWCGSLDGKCFRGCLDDCAGALGPPPCAAFALEPECSPVCESLVPVHACLVEVSANSTHDCHAKILGVATDKFPSDNCPFR